MIKNYITQKLAWTLKALMSLALLLTGAAAAHAASADYGLLELGKAYDLPMYGSVSGYYTATEAGVIKVTTTCADFPDAWADEAHTTQMEKSVTINGSTRTYDLSLEEGQTVYFYRKFCMNEGTFTLSKQDGIELTSVTPQGGSSFTYGGDPSVTFKFSVSVKIGGAQIVIGGYTQDIAANVSGSTVHITPKTDIKELVESGKLQKGDTFSFRLTNVRMLSDETKLYGEDGTCEVSYTCGGKPIELVSVSGLLDSDNMEFLSYWPGGDSRGILRMTFSGELCQPEANSEKHVVTLGFGNAEGEAGEYYTENVPYTTEGNTLVCDFTGKLRTPDLMVTSGTNYGSMRVKVLNVTDKDGNYAYADNSGSLGSYTYRLGYTEVKADITTEFTPASGEALTGDEIELWTTDYDKISFDGILFTYADGGQPKTLVSTDYTATADTGVEGAYIIKIAVPAEVKGKSDITVTLNNLVVADGADHSADFTAKYNSLVIKKVSYQSPEEGAVAVSLANSTIDNFAEGGKIYVTTNMDSQIGYATYQVRDLDADDPAEEIIMTTASLRHPDGDDGQPDLTQPLEAEIYGGVTKFYKKHTYRLEVTAYASESDFTYHNGSIGADSVKFEGTTEPFTFSSVQFVSADPADGSSLPDSEDAVITLTWDGMVELGSSTSFVNLGQGATLPITSIEAVDDDGGLSNQWKLTVSKDMFATLGGELMLSIVATDADYKLVEGNSGHKENSYLSLSYTITGADAEPNITISPADGEEVESLYQFTVSSAGNVSISESYSGDEIKLYSVAGHGTEAAKVTSIELVIPEGKEDDFSYEPTAVTLTLDHEVTEPGVYYLNIPAAFFILGEQFSTEYNTAVTAYYTVTGNGEEPTPDVPATLHITADPENGSTVASLSTISLTFDDYEEVGIGNGKLSYTKDGGDAVSMNDAELDFDVYNKALIRFTTTLTEKGTYVINVPEGYFTDANGDALPAFKLTYGIGMNTGIASINGEDSAPHAVYTLSGVRTTTPPDQLPAGVYVVNGKKVLVK